MNFGETEEVVQVSKFTDLFGDQLRVLVAGVDTFYEKGFVFSHSFAFAIYRWSFLLIATF